MATPTGTLTRISPDDVELVVSRRIHAPIDEVWQSATASEHTARWIGPWAGEPGAGRTVVLTMMFEEGHPPSDVHITACDEPTHLAVTTGSGDYSMELELRLSVVDDSTEIALVHHLADPAQAAVYGGGWDYYLDQFVASREGAALPSFDDYAGEQFTTYYSELAEAL